MCLSKSLDDCYTIRKGEGGMTRLSFALAWGQNTMYAQTKHINIAHHFLRDLVQDGVLQGLA